MDDFSISAPEVWPPVKICLSQGDWKLRPGTRVLGVPNYRQAVCTRGRTTEGQITSARLSSIGVPLLNGIAQCILSRLVFENCGLGTRRLSTPMHLKAG